MNETKSVSSIRFEPLIPQSDDHADRTDHAASSWVLRGRRLLRSCLPAELLLLARESRSLAGRIRVVHRMRWDTASPLLPEPLLREMVGVLVPRTHIHEYSEDMKSLRDRYPFLTRFDLHIASLAWSAGIRYAVCSSDMLLHQEESSQSPRRSNQESNSVSVQT